MLHGVFAEDVLLRNCIWNPFWGPSVLAGLPEMQTIGVATTNGSLCLLLTSGAGSSGSVVARRLALLH